MSTFLPFVVAGLAGGSIYGVAGAGFVLTYRTSGIFNFAFPAMATIAAFVFFFLHYDTYYFNALLSWPVALAIAVLVVGPLMGLGMELIARGLAKVSIPLQITATIGILLGVTGFLGFFYENQGAQLFNPFLSQSTFSLLGTSVTYDELTLFLFGLVSVIALYVFFRVTRLGSAMRAVVDNPDLLGLTGTSPAAVRRWAWVIGSMFAAATGVFLAPTLSSLEAGGLLALVVASFGAAAIGAFSSLPWTFVGGLVIGVLGSVATKYESSAAWLANVQAALPFIVLYVVLLVTKQSKLADTRVDVGKTFRRSYHAPPRVRLVAGAVAVAVFAFVPAFASGYVSLWGEGLIYVILILSAGLAIKEAGMVSLCQTAFAAIGGVVFAHVATQLHWPFFGALLFAGFISLLFGAFIAIPAIRVSGVFLALATYGFGLALMNLLYPTGVMFTGASDGLANIPRPDFAESTTGFYFVLLAITVVTCLTMISIDHGRLGRLMRGLGDSPVALNTIGSPVNTVRVIVFSISAFFAGIAGALYGPFFHDIGLGTPFYQPGLSIEVFIIIMLIGAGTPWYGVLGAAAIEIVPGYISTAWNFSNIQPYLSLLLGAAVIIVISPEKRPIMPLALQRLSERFGPRPKAAITAPVARLRPNGAGLAVTDLTVRFGGTVAVSSLSLAAPFERITGLIGPNGAGKTTTFNAASGLLAPGKGAISYNGRDISPLSPSARARLGLGRTFQTIDLWETLTVRDNLALGYEAPMSGRGARSLVMATGQERREMGAAVIEAADLAGITDLLGRTVHDLSTGQRRLVELARVLAGPFDLLLLDEPSAGLDRTETSRLAAVLREVVKERGAGVLLVEHDVPLVREVCDYIYVMDFGVLVFEGTPDEVMRSSVVQAAYLGTEGDETSTSAPSAVEIATPEMR
jgi:ABC-type branched-subunit amino acid transport system ATPase component/branched-subunit amino acid ABC-type transport system permease component